MTREKLENMLKSEEYVAIVPSVNISLRKLGNEYQIIYYRSGYFRVSLLYVRNKRVRIKKSLLDSKNSYNILDFYKHSDLRYLISNGEHIGIIKLGECTKDQIIEEVSL